MPKSQLLRATLGFDFCLFLCCRCLNNLIHNLKRQFWSGIHYWCAGATLPGLPRVDCVYLFQKGLTAQQSLIKKLLEMKNFWTISSQRKKPYLNLNRTYQRYSCHWSLNTRSGISFAHEHTKKPNRPFHTFPLKP